MNAPRLRLPGLLLGTALTLPAQSWTEFGDAGPLPNIAQVPVGTGPLAAIVGALTQNDADMYLIQIDAPAAFSATTLGSAIGDTQLFLFDTSGRGVSFDDDGASATYSTLSGANVLRPGKYLLAISSYDNDPRANGAAIWNDAPYGLERAPDGPHRLEAIDSWDNNGFYSGNYVITLTGASFVSREAVLPDYQYLCESQTQLANSGSTAWWRQAGGRFQLLYEASHLLSAGVTGPITIDALKFRGEDGEPNLGGQSWAGVTVQLGSTSLTSATMSTTFATNRDPLTTTLGAVGTTTVTVLPSRGTTPNDYNIVIDLAALAATYALDPNGARPNLLIDITLPNAATVPTVSGAVMAMQDAITPAVGTVRAKGLNTATPASATGTSSTAPLLVALEWSGPGGRDLPIPARNEFIGASCGASASAFYQSFLQGQDFDLTGLTLTPDNLFAPTKYTVSAGASAFDPTKVGAAPLSVADDAVLAATPIGFTLAYPGGSTTTLRPCTNGFVWLDPAMSVADLSPTIDEFLGVGNYTARFAPFWMDLHAGRNTATHPNSGLHMVTDTSGGPGNAVCYVTWLDCGIFNTVSTTGSGGNAIVDCQLVIHEATGVVEFRYGTMPRAGSSSNPSAILVGWSRGMINGVPSVDPVSRDLSVEVPFSTSIEVAGTTCMSQTAVAAPVAGGAHYAGRMFAGQTILWNVTHVPATTLFGAQLLDITASRPGFAMSLLSPGCMISTGPNPVVYQLNVMPPSTVNGTLPFSVPPGYEGLTIVSQYVTYDTSGIVFTSNALLQTIGLD